MQSLEEAQQALKDFFDSLSTAQRQQALDYQRGIEEEAARTEGGMPVVIMRRLSHMNLSLLETLHEVHEEIVNNEIRRISRGDLKHD